MSTKGRDKEASLIRDANVASAAGRLLLGEISSWNDFLEPDLIDYASLPRRQLKSGKNDIQKSLQGRIDGFCKSNFQSMTRDKLVLLYEELKAHRRLEIPYIEFSRKYSAFFKIVVASFNQAASFFSSFSGFKATSPMGFQSRVLPDQRSGVLDLANS